MRLSDPAALRKFLRLVGSRRRSPSRGVVIRVCSILGLDTTRRLSHLFFDSAIHTNTLCTPIGPTMPLSFLYVPEADLYKSEPPPEWFGNPSNEKGAGWTNDNWLKSRFHFSFAEYRNPKNTQFGCLRVMNDDLVQGNRGFGEHPHRDMEIITFIVEGVLTHQDSTGTRESLGRGSVQFMTAGTGIYHSEHNLDSTPLRFIQIWITPRAHGLKPCYGGFDGTTAAAMAARNNSLHQIVGDMDNGAHNGVPVRIAQDCNVYVAELKQGAKVDLPMRGERQAYLLCVEGDIALGGGHEVLKLTRHDATEVRANGDGVLSITSGSSGPALILVLEMARGAGGRGPGKWPMHLG